ncbi:MAG: hypothetical protein PHS73_00355 [Candidatus Peribacteraceae bacterium]|nr:hypothetical protein [Candidatus Peribacteraceae bacterium]
MCLAAQELHIGHSLNPLQHLPDMLRRQTRVIPDTDPYGAGLLLAVDMNLKATTRNRILQLYGVSGKPDTELKGWQGLWHRR